MVGRWSFIALWLVVAYLGIAMAITLSRCHYRFTYYDMGEFWTLTGLLGLGFAGLVAVAVWISRPGTGP
jgi:hypothetical protein